MSINGMLGTVLFLSQYGKTWKAFARFLWFFLFLLPSINLVTFPLVQMLTSLVLRKEVKKCIQSCGIPIGTEKSREKLPTLELPLTKSSKEGAPCRQVVGHQVQTVDTQVQTLSNLCPVSFQT